MCIAGCCGNYHFNVAKIASSASIVTKSLPISLRVGGPSIVGCCGNITQCCMSYHKDTVMSLSNYTIQFSRKSILFMLPIKSRKKLAILYTCSTYHSTTDVHVCCQTATRKLRFCTTSVLLSIYMSMTQFKKHFFMEQKMHK